MRKQWRIAGLGIAMMAGSQAGALPVVPVAVSASVATDNRVRGLSWNEGQVGGQAAVTLGGGSGFYGLAGVTSLSDQRRFDGADVAVDLSAGYAAQFGGLTADGAVVYRAFPGAEDRDFIELSGRGSARLGPVEGELLVNYAPDQEALGGDNLYARAGARVAVIGTPVTLAAYVGHTSGSGDDRAETDLLRPAGDYWDWRLGADYVLGPVTLGLAYVDTDVKRGDLRAADFRRGDADATVVASVGVSF